MRSRSGTGCSRSCRGSRASTRAWRSATLRRWYAYGFPAVYILAAAGAVRFARYVARSPRLAVGLAVLVLVPAVVLANLDVVGSTRPMELLLFQPAHWSYLWSR